MPKRSKKNSTSGILVLLACVFAAAFLLQHPGLLIGILAVVVAVVAVAVALKVRRRAIAIKRLGALRLADVDEMSGIAFERYVADLLEHQGYKTRMTKSTGDLGVDIVAARGDLSYAVQCKRVGDDLSRNAVSDAVAGKTHYRCTHAMVVTNRSFRKGAKELAESTGCILIGRTELSAWADHFRDSFEVRNAVSRTPDPSAASEPTNPPTGPICWLTAISGPLSGQRFPVAQDFEIGREATGIALASDSLASRRHARITVTATGPGILDLGSTNGTILNGARVTEAAIRPGDLVQIGSTVLRVE